MALILLFSGKRRKLKGSPKSKLVAHRNFKIVWESGILVFSMMKESLIYKWDNKLYAARIIIILRNLVIRDCRKLCLTNCILDSLIGK